jgi:hypothetical protein
MMAEKDFSLKDFVNDLIEGLPGPELSWDFKLDVIQGRYAIRIPIKLYGDRKPYLRERVLGTANKFGFDTSSIYMRSDYDFVLERYFSDITATPLGQK